MQYGMVIDLRRCMGCSTCAMACKCANNMPNNVWWNRVLTDGGQKIDTARVEADGTYVMNFMPVTCQHCANPACVEVCPTGATYKDAETGIVIQDPEVCIGCKLCLEACPYEGVRTYLEDEPKYELDFAVGYADAQPHIQSTVEKCSFCFTRIAEGEKPACMQLCPGRARYYGDLDDPESEVAKLVASREYKQLNTEAGTGPSVYYLI